MRISLRRKPKSEQPEPPTKDLGSSGAATKQPAAATAERPAATAAAAPSRTAEKAKPTPPSDIASRLDGMRGWLGDLDRTVGIRSRIGLVLAAIAIGAAGAAIYLSLTAKEQSASDRDVEGLRGQLQSVERQASDTAQEVTRLKSSVDAVRSQASKAGTTASSLQSQIKQLQNDVSDLQQSVSAVAKSGGAASTPSTPTTPGTTTTTPSQSGGGTSGTP